MDKLIVEMQVSHIILLYIDYQNSIRKSNFQLLV